MRKNTLAVAVVLMILLAVGGVVFYYQFYKPSGPLPSNLSVNQPFSPLPKVVIKNFDECVAAGNPVMESYPRQCRANGQTFNEDIGNELEKTDLIIIDTPRPNEVIASPLKISGKARGTWFFEASFPVKLLDADGNVLALVPAQAQSDWMTEEFVPYKVTLEFETPTTDRGTLILQKDNPSGLPEYEDSLIVPIRFR